MKLRKMLKYVSVFSPVCLFAEDGSGFVFENREEISECFYEDKVKGVGTCKGIFKTGSDTFSCLECIEIYINRDNFDGYYEEEE